MLLLRRLELASLPRSQQRVERRQTGEQHAKLLDELDLRVRDAIPSTHGAVVELLPMEIARLGREQLGGRTEAASVRQVCGAAPLPTRHRDRLQLAEQLVADRCRLRLWQAHRILHLRHLILWLDGAQDGAHEDGRFAQDGAHAVDAREHLVGILGHAVPDDGHGTDAWAWQRAAREAHSLAQALDRLRGYDRVQGLFEALNILLDLHDGFHKLLGVARVLRASAATRRVQVETRDLVDLVGCEHALA